MMEAKKLEVSLETLLVLAVDVPKQTKKPTSSPGVERAYFAITGADLKAGLFENAVRVPLKRRAVGNIKDTVSGAAQKVNLVIYPTKTYQAGFGGGLFADIAPEDRSMYRMLSRRFPESVECYKVSLEDTDLFDQIQGYFADAEEKQKYEQEREQGLAREENADRKWWKKPIEFDFSYIKNAKSIFKTCMTKPNRQDYFYLVTKTFGLNLFVKTAFALHGVKTGALPLVRAVMSTGWYLTQDILFTTFGQTYMKFLGRMTGMFRVGPAFLGDFLFVYIQFCFLEFLNRLILGPIGENPLVYTWAGVGLILLNNFQGLVSGGPLTPAINKIRRSGVISHSTMMHLYQFGSITLYFGMFASYGYQMVYALLTGGMLLFSWGSYILFSVAFKDPVFVKADPSQVAGQLDLLASYAYDPRALPRQRQGISAESAVAAANAASAGADASAVV